MHINHPALVLVITLLAIKLMKYVACLFYCWSILIKCDFFSILFLGHLSGGHFAN